MAPWGAAPRSGALPTRAGEGRPGPPEEMEDCRALCYPWPLDPDLGRLSQAPFAGRCAAWTAKGGTLAYLSIMVLVAAAGILRLWLIQRRERALATADDFLAGLEKIATHLPTEPVAKEGRVSRWRLRRRRGRSRHLDPARRSAAKRRIEARRDAAGRRGPTRNAPRRRAPRKAVARSSRRLPQGKKAQARSSAVSPRSRRATGGARAARPARRSGRSARVEGRRARPREIDLRDETRGHVARRSGQSPRVEGRPERPREIDLRDKAPGHVVLRQPASPQSAYLSEDDVQRAATR